ncbi:unnamed protein product [Trichobilharzia szidati]|nr:unnamed protein product [Trichobilharzia szidati]
MWYQSSSPNIAKPFHLGHFRATVIGNFVKHINEAFGHNVIGINYIGDWGSQFDLLTSAFLKYGNENEFQKNPIEYLYKLYVQANQDENLLNERKMVTQGISYASDSVKSLHRAVMNSSTVEESLRTDFLQRVRRVTNEQLKLNYKRMNVQFTSFEYESDYVSKAHLLVEKLLALGLAYKTPDGLICMSTENVSDVNFSRQNIVLLKSDKSTLYLTRDIAAAISRYEQYQFDRIHYVVEIGQRLHFQQLHYVLVQMGYKWPVLSVKWDHDDDDDDESNQGVSNPQCAHHLHIPFGRVIGMSTRKGEGLFLSNILDNAQQFMLNRMKSSRNTRINQNESPVDPSSLSQEGIADHLGVTCLATTMFNTLRQKPMKLSTFLGLPVTNSQLSSSSSTVNHSQVGELCGLTLQYCHARLCSLESRMISSGLLLPPTSVCPGDHGSLVYDEHSLIHYYDQLKEWPSTTANDECFIALINELSRFSSVLQSAYSSYEPHYILQYALQLTSAINSAWKRLPVLTCSSRNDQLLRGFIFLASRNVLACCLQLMGIMPLKAI